MSTEITIDKKEAYYEIIEILKYMDEKYVKKIPKQLIYFFKSNSANNYKFRINTQLPLKQQTLKEETRVILAMLNLNYWSTEEHKQELLKLYKNNEEIYQKKLREKYNPDDIFKNRNRIVPQEEQPSEETRMTVVQEEKWYHKIFNLIKGLFYSN